MLINCLINCRLHPASAGIINLKLWQTDTTASKNTSDAGGDNNRSSCLVLVTQGRDGTTHMWELDNELNIVEGYAKLYFFLI